MLSREELLARADALPGLPDAIEAFWDGDTQGWFIVLSAVFRQVEDTKAKYKDFYLGILQGEGGDFRLFVGQVPPWPEATYAQEIGQEIAEGLGVPFYFPSPEYPEAHCPRWWQRAAGYPCRQCRILLLQLERLPWRGLCNHCHREEEKLKKLNLNSRDIDK
jgi:hypothetical protein